MKNVKLLIQYEGTNYSGWQSQTNALGIQQVIEESLERITNESISLKASGRTDGGVHALGQVANFYTDSSIPGYRFKYPLNISLPDDIRIIDSQTVDMDFNSRHDAIKKKYKYLIYNSPMENPIYRNFSYYVARDLDIRQMESSFPYLIGIHDFKSFMGPRTEVNSTIRHIYSMELEQKEDLIEIIIKGNSFLRHMIRIIIGTLVHIGLGKIKKEDLPKIIQGKDRSLAGPTAPAQGLFLDKVYY